ncbi:MAG: 4-oxalocrotonate tautomerase [Bacteroidota bacterium]
MPVYSVTTHAPLSKMHKEKMVHAITDLHCGLTGAPEQFVHVLFSDGLPLKPGIEVYVHANTRANRPKELVAKVGQQLINDTAMALDISTEQVQIKMLEIQASWIMEGGKIMPEPGEEGPWMEAMKRELEAYNKNRVEA